MSPDDPDVSGLNTGSGLESLEVVLCVGLPELKGQSPKASARPRRNSEVGTGLTQLWGLLCLLDLDLFDVRSVCADRGLHQLAHQGVVGDALGALFVDARRVLHGEAAVA